MDSYVDPVLRMHERCTAPRRSLIGNWVHSFPDDAYPGPNLDWLHEMVRFFDHWLKGIDNGVMDEPAFVVFRHEYAEPEPFPLTWPGAWLGLTVWPPPALAEHVLHLASGDSPLNGTLAAQPGPDPAVERFRHRPTIGTRASLSWGAGSAPNGLARDLRPEESLIPTFTSAPLEEPLDVVGFAVAELALESSAEVATAVVRLMDVAPDGASSQVTAGILNLTHRDSHAEPAPLTPGTVHHVRVPLRATAHRFLPGHRLRLSVASAYWPVIWPSPEPAEFGLHLGGPNGTRLVLPILPADAAVAEVPPFKTSASGLLDRGEYRDEPPEWRVVDDVLDGSVTVVTSEHGEVSLPDDAVSLYSGERLEMTARDDDPAKARMHNDVVYRLRDGDTEVLIEATGTVTSTSTEFEIEGSLQVTLDGEAFHARDWREIIPRRLV
jgi:hypothetical protein